MWNITGIYWLDGSITVIGSLIIGVPIGVYLARKIANLLENKFDLF